MNSNFSLSVSNLSKVTGSAIAGGAVKEAGEEREGRGYFLKKPALSYLSYST